MRRWLRRKLINFVVKRLYKFVSADEVLIQTRGGLFINGQPLELKHVKELQGQAKIIIEMDVYKLIRRELIEISNRKMFNESKNIDDMMFGKAMLYCLDLIHQKLSKLSKM